MFPGAQPAPRIVAVLDDLFFTVKIQDAAKRVGLPIVFVKDTARVWEHARRNPALMIFDLNSAAVDAVSLIRELKADQATRPIDILAYVSHVQTTLRASAQEAGADFVLARSSFSHDLPSILQRYQ